MTAYISHKKALKLRESGRLKDRPILPGDFVFHRTWRPEIAEPYAERVGVAQSDDGPRFRAEVTAVRDDPLQGKALFDHIAGQWQSLWAFLEQCEQQWLAGQSSDHFEYDLGEVSNEHGRTYSLNLLIRFHKAVAHNPVTFVVETEDDDYNYQRGWLSDWPYPWRRRAKSGPVKVLRCFDWTLTVSEVESRMVPLITKAEYRRINAALKAGRPFEWGGPARIAPEWAGSLHRRWQRDDVFVDESDQVYYVLDGRYSTAVKAVVPAGKEPATAETLFALAGGEEALFVRLHGEYKAWEANREAAGTPTDDPFDTFDQTIRLGEHKGRVFFLHFRTNPLGPDSLRFAGIDDDANYEAWGYWTENNDSPRTLQWRYQRLRHGQGGVKNEVFEDYAFDSDGWWAGKFNPNIGPDDVEGIYLLSGPAGEFWVTESDLHTRYKALLKQSEFNALLKWEANNHQHRAVVQSESKVPVEYLIEPAAGRKFRLVKSMPAQREGDVPLLLLENVSLTTAKRMAVRDAMWSFPYNWQDGKSTFSSCSN